MFQDLGLLSGCSKGWVSSRENRNRILSSVRFSFKPIGMVPRTETTSFIVICTKGWCDSEFMVWLSSKCQYTVTVILQRFYQSNMIFRTKGSDLSCPQFGFVRYSRNWSVFSCWGKPNLRFDWENSLNSEISQKIVQFFLFCTRHDRSLDTDWPTAELA